MILLLRGGLGNQMFRYAFGYLQSTKLKKNLYIIDLTSFESTPRNFSLEVFGIKRYIKNKTVLRFFNLFFYILGIICKKIPLLSKFYIRDSNYCELKTLSLNNAFILDGHMQKSNYFVEDREKVKSIFTFPKVPKNHQIVDFSLNKKYVAMHIRRGDYVSDNKSQELHLVCDMDWYLKALDLLNSKIDNTQLIIFTDDEFWVKEQFKKTDHDVFVVPNNEDREPWIDLYFISRCDHFIISNSSFSWWGAFLGEVEDSLVIVPEYWFKGIKTDSIGICPANWLQI